MTPEIFLNGDEHYAWKTDRKGYTVIQDEQGWYVYAKKINGELVPSGVRVGYGSPKKLGLTPNLATDPHKRQFNYLRTHDGLERDHREVVDVPTSALCSFSGTKSSPCRLKGLVVLIRFSDHKSKVLPGPEEYDVLFNHNGPTANDTAPTGSVANVFMENSYDSFVLETKISPRWVDVPRTQAQTVAGHYGLNLAETRTTWRIALEILEQSGFDFRQVDENNDGILDCLVILHSGPAAETRGTDCETGVNDRGRIWSHATEQTWFTSKTGIRNKRFYVASGVWDTCPKSRQPWTKWGIARIAVIAQECSHFLGLPGKSLYTKSAKRPLSFYIIYSIFVLFHSSDTYDTQGGVGLGNFDLLANM